MAVPESWEVGADIGGTFTDIVAIAPDGQVRVAKVLSTPDNYVTGVIEGISSLCQASGLSPGAIGKVVHGTTVATNAILEKKGAQTGLITTKGFRDVLEIGRLRRPKLYDMFWEKPAPLVERYLCAEVDERTDAGGAILRELRADQLLEIVRQLIGKGIQSLAVCLLHSYANALHEKRIGTIVRENFPDLYLSLSHEIVPEAGEYERTSTTVINAYVMPLVDRYLRNLEADIRELGIPGRLFIMRSSGGIMTAPMAIERPLHIIESGPAAGVVSGAEWGRRCGLENIITFDMGGTTAKASMIEKGQFMRSAEYEVGAGANIGMRLLRGGGHTLRAPAIDLVEVGAGGGSLVQLDLGGVTHVGPESAGADPGPICYGRGGKIPTLTDANVILGYLNPDYLLGGNLRLDFAPAQDIFQQRIAKPLGLSLEDGAYKAHLIANSNMMRALRVVSVERGRDPRQFSLLAFGGNGPLHAAGLAALLRIPKVVIPPWAGLFSSFGLLCADVEHTFAKSFRKPTRELSPWELLTVFKELQDQAIQILDAEGYLGDISFHREMGLRYIGQTWDLRVPLELSARGPDVAAVEAAFQAEHERLYAHRAAGDPIEVVTLYISARPETGDIALQKIRRLSLTRKHPLGQRKAYFGPDLGWIEAPVVPRGALQGVRTLGPLIVEENDSTTLVPPGTQAMVDSLGNIEIAVPI